MATDYAEDGSRIGLDGGSIAWQAACETVVTDWVKTDQVIFSAHANSASHAPATESFKLQWRNVTDSGTFADLVTGSGELRAGTSAGAITNTDPIGSSDGCGTGTPTIGEEVENESPLQTASLTQASKNNSMEMQWCVDFSNAVDSKEYAFQLYSVTGAAALGQCTSTITTAAPAAPTPKAFTDDVTGSDVFTKATILQTKAFADTVAGADVFETLYREMGFADSVTGSDVFTLLRFLDFVDAIAGADVMTLTRPIYFTDSGSGADVFTQPYREMGFVDVIAGADVFETPFRAMGWADSGSGTEIFFLLAEKAVVDTVSGADVWTVPLKIITVAFVDSATGTDVFVTPYREMGFSDSVTGVDLFELLRFLAFSDVGSGSDVFSLLREMGFADTIGGADVFTTPYREMGVSDTITGSDVFTQPYREMEFADVALGTDVFSAIDLSGVVSKFVVDTGYGFETFTHISDVCPVDTIHGLDVFMVTKPEIIVKISETDLVQVGITEADLVQILITEGALSQVKITEEDI